MLTEEEALNAVAYIVADMSLYADDSVWELILTYETSKSIVHEAWQKSKFNEEGYSLGACIANDHVNEWLVCSSYDDKIKFMREMR